MPSPLRLTLLLVALVLSLGLGIALIVSPTPPPPREAAPSAPDSAASTPPSAPRSEAPITAQTTPEPPAVATDLPIELIGVLLMERAPLSLAAIYDKELGITFALRSGELIQGKLKLEKLEPGKITFQNLKRNRKEFAVLSRKGAPALTSTSPLWKNVEYPGIKRVTENHLVVDPSVLKETLSRLPQVLTEARCLPTTEQGRITGFSCSQIVRGSIYDRLGLQENDQVTELNGVPLDSVQAAMTALQNAQAGNELRVMIKRGGKTFPMTLEVH